MSRLSKEDFCALIAKDYGIDPKDEDVLKLPVDKKILKNWVSGRARNIRIFDGSNEHPYMLEQSLRNEDALSKGIELRITYNKGLFTILKETGLTLKNEYCKICEGNGWYSHGTRYFYKDFFCDI